MNLISYRDIVQRMQRHRDRLQQISTEKRAPPVSSPPPTFRLNYISSSRRDQFRIDESNRKLLNKIIEYSTAPSPHVGQRSEYKAPRSNRLAQRLYQVNVQNKRMYDRLTKIKSGYSLSQLNKSNRLRQNYLNNISRYGHKDFTPNKTLIPLIPGSKIRRRTEHKNTDGSIKTSSNLNLLAKEQLGPEAEGLVWRLKDGLLLQVRQGDRSQQLQLGFQRASEILRGQGQEGQWSGLLRLIRKNEESDEYEIECPDEHV